MRTESKSSSFPESRSYTWIDKPAPKRGQIRSVRGVINRLWGTEPNEVNREGSLLRLPADPELHVEIPYEKLPDAIGVVVALTNFEIREGKKSPKEDSETPDVADDLRTGLVSAYVDKVPITIVPLTQADILDLQDRLVAMYEGTQDRIMARNAGRFISFLQEGYQQRLKEVR